MPDFIFSLIRKNKVMPEFGIIPSLVLIISLQICPKLDLILSFRLKLISVLS